MSTFARPKSGLTRGSREHAGPHRSRRAFLSTMGAGLAGVLGARGVLHGAEVSSGAGAQGGAIAPASGEGLAAVRRHRKVDAHAHLGFGPSLRLPTDALLRAADRLHIERLAISIPSGPQPSHVAAANSQVLEAMRAYPDRLIGQCCVNPLYPAAAREEVKRCLGEGMWGLGELYTYAKASDPVYFPLVELCIEHRAPLLWHARADLAFVRPGVATGEPRTTTTAADLVELARRYPEAVLIHGHIGGGGDWEHACLTLRESPSVRVDTSGSVSEPGMVEFAVRTLGVERVLFGTDMNFEAGVGKMLSANLRESERERVFAGNFDELLRYRGLHAH